MGYLQLVTVCLLVSVLICTAQKQDDVEKLKNVVSVLARQVMLQQLAAEEKIRADGDSGIKQIRIERAGPRPYYSNSHTGNSVGAIHDHSNVKNMIGQGEGQFVLNGVEFRTRHNDYLMRRPTTKSKAYNVLQELPYPDVPPEVTSKASLPDKIAEMREWFKAWKDQNYTVRDYRPYFRPVLCYLEGAWTTVISEDIEEPFHSTRHAIDADTWFDLQEKIRFTSYTGRKSLSENFAYLPTILMNVTETGVPVYGQWNYRMLCHPLKGDLPTKYFKVVDDISARLPRGQDLWEFEKTRAARFELVGPKDNRFTTWSLLDKLMSEVPGKDNYPADLTERSFGYNFLHPVIMNDTLLNVGYYHRGYRRLRRDAMGLQLARRGFCDPTVFMAETSQPRIAPMYARHCKKGKCSDSLKRMSYAVPLEVIYLTPLNKWNPYNLRDRKMSRSKVTNSGKRNGGFTKETAFDGTCNELFYRTPTDLFSGGEVQRDPADTVQDSVGVLDKKGNVRRASSSGVRIFLPEIPGVGTLRQRYPIVPVHGEGSAVWKELNALKDIMMRFQSNQKYLYENISVSTGEVGDNGPVKLFIYTTSTGSKVPPGPHSHTIEFTEAELSQMRQGHPVDAITSKNNGHSHPVTVRYSNNRFHIASCDDDPLPCWDGHTACLMAEWEDSCSNM